MSMWAQAQQLPIEEFKKILEIYGDHFPIEVRATLAGWIESKMCPVLPEDHLTMFVEEFVQEIRAQANMMQADKHVTKMKLLEAAQYFAQYNHTPRELYAFMQQLLTAEMEVIQRCLDMNFTQGPNPNTTERKYSELITGLHGVRHNVNLANDEIRNLTANIECFSIHYHECVKRKGHLSYLEQSNQMPADRRDLEARLRNEINGLEGKLNALMLQIKQAQIIIVDRIKDNITRLCDLQSQVLDVELIRWKREQQLEGNGEKPQSNLNNIQDWCESLAELIWATRQQLNNLIRLHSKSATELRQQHLVELCDEMNKQVTSLLSTLVTSTFVIEKQPPQVMKTNTRFTATVRLLVGGQLNVHMVPPRVKVMIISEQQAQLLLKSEGTGRAKEPVECGDILNNTGNMEYQASTKQLSVSFKNMQLRKIKRAEKKGTESVMDEKLTLLFQSDFKVGHGELVFQVWTLSLPVVVIVHGNQEPHGWATVTWDNAFSPPGRVPFHVPDKVTWGQLADTLRTKFRSATGGALTDSHLQYLAGKIFRQSPPINMMELNNMTVSWTQFCKDALPDRNFTFWEWFYMVVKLTRDFLRTLWCDNLIMGFIPKKQAEEILSKCQPGTFLLRFSDSELGGITIAWVGESSEVYSVQPFTARDLQQRALADRIQDLQDMQCLYPNVPKDEVFSKYYSKPEQHAINNGYVKPVLVTTLPYMSPSPHYAHSPDSQRNTPSVQSRFPTEPELRNRYENVILEDLFN